MEITKFNEVLEEAKGTPADVFHATCMALIDELISDIDYTDLIQSFLNTLEEQVKQMEEDITRYRFLIKILRTCSKECNRRNSFGERMRKVVDYYKRKFNGSR